eukprot:TRINITY_DN1695_c0_g1_i11.p1 TRINITY_DN1695_c0_g1~~TRINITY_DN1695_c0_g1_i11.p1  ORF type:complete len:295 (+),score=46.56 TRINITY_DN1695_c0_g1_i11:218-1102(+)
MSRIAIILALVHISSGTTLNILAGGSLPDGSSGGAVGTGVGANVAGTAVVDVDEDSSRSSLVLTATGGVATTSPKPIVTTIVKPQVTAVKPAKKGYYHPLPVCEHIKDKCEAIKEYKKCGYCYTQKYPTKGYGCSYTEQVITKKVGGSKKEYKYETVITPTCKCEGVYIIDAHACPTCDTLLAELLLCAGVKDAKRNDEIKIPQSCLKATGVTEKILLDCGFLKPLAHEKVNVSKKEKVEKPKEVVIIKKEKIPVVAKKTPKPVIATASASASASAFGSGTAIADATATVVTGH